MLLVLAKALNFSWDTTMSLLFLGAKDHLITARELPLEEPPPIVRQSLKQYFARWSRAQAVLAQKPRSVHAGLLSGRRQDVALAGVATGDDDAIHLLNTA